MFPALVSLVYVASFYLWSEDPHAVSMVRNMVYHVQRFLPLGSSHIELKWFPPWFLPCETVDLLRAGMLSLLPEGLLYIKSTLHICQVIIHMNERGNGGMHKNHWRLERLQWFLCILHYIWRLTFLNCLMLAEVGFGKMDVWFKVRFFWGGHTTHLKLNALYSLYRLFLSLVIGIWLSNLFFCHISFSISF